MKPHTGYKYIGLLFLIGGPVLAAIIFLVFTSIRDEGWKKSLSVSGKNYGELVPLLAMPEYYFQDRFLLGNINLQRHVLADYDLRKTAVLDKAEWNEQSEGITLLSPVPAAEALAGFTELQKNNLILAIREMSTDKTILKTEITRPAMLVIDRTWSPWWTATRDGKKSHIFRVNYQQVGIWCKPGTVTIVLQRLDPRLEPGLAGAALALVSLLGGAIFLRFGRGGPG